MEKEFKWINLEDFHLEELCITKASYLWRVSFLFVAIYDKERKTFHFWTLRLFALLSVRLFVEWNLFISHEKLIDTVHDFMVLCNMQIYIEQDAVLFVSYLLPNDRLISLSNTWRWILVEFSLWYEKKREKWFPVRWYNQEMNLSWTAKRNIFFCNTQPAVSHNGIEVQLTMIKWMGLDCMYFVDGNSRIVCLHLKWSRTERIRWYGIMGLGG